MSFESHHSPQTQRTKERHGSRSWRTWLSRYASSRQKQSTFQGQGRKLGNQCLVHLLSLISCPDLPSTDPSQKLEDLVALDLALREQPLKTDSRVERVENGSERNTRKFSSTRQTDGLWLSLASTPFPDIPLFLLCPIMLPSSHCLLSIGTLARHFQASFHATDEGSPQF